MKSIPERNYWCLSCKTFNKTFVFSLSSLKKNFFYFSRENMIWYNIKKHKYLMHEIVPCFFNVVCKMQNYNNSKGRRKDNGNTILYISALLIYREWYGKKYHRRRRRVIIFSYMPTSLYLYLKDWQCVCVDFSNEDIIFFTLYTPPIAHVVIPYLVIFSMPPPLFYWIM